MAIELLWVREGINIYAFLLVFVLTYAILEKTKILGASKPIDFILSFIFGVIFFSFLPARTYILDLAAGFSVLLAISFFALLFIYFMAEKPAAMLKPITIIFLILLGLIMIFLLFHAIPSLQSYLPGGDEGGGIQVLLNIKHFLLQESMLHTYIFIILTAIVGFFIVR